MAFGDWDFFFANGATAGIQAIDAIVGSASLEVTSPSNGIAHGHRKVAFPRGFLKGKVRTLLRLDAELFQPKAGLYCMTETSGLLGAGQSCYTLRYEAAVGSNNFSLEKHTGGLGGATTTLDETTIPQIAPGSGDVMAIELEWNLDIPALGGIFIIGRVGTINDLTFGSLTSVLSVTDFSPFLTSESEGIFAQSSNLNSGTWTFETTEIFSGV